MGDIGVTLIVGAICIAWFGTAAMLLWTGITDPFERAVPLIAGGFLALSGIGLLLAAYDDATAEHTYISLRADEWNCTQSETITTPVLVGKVIVPTERRECNQYSKGVR